MNRLAALKLLASQLKLSEESCADWGAWADAEETIDK